MLCYTVNRDDIKTISHNKSRFRKGRLFVCLNIKGGECVDCWKSEAERLLFVDKKSWAKLTEQIQQNNPDLTAGNIRDYLKSTQQYKLLHPKPAQTNRPVGVFSDPHIPFDHPNYLQFCIDTFKKYNVGQVVCCGDLVDNHAISRHQTETCAKSACDELDMALETVAKYTKAFPKLKMCIGNHDTNVERQAATVGIDKRFLKSRHDLLGLPKTWEIAEEFIIDDVLYKHGLNCLGKDGVINTAIAERMSTVIGHSHSFGGCKYSANKRDIIFGLNVGCGIDIDAYAFAYGKYDKNRPTLGCGIVFNDSNAIFVPMGKEFFRSNQEVAI